MRCAFFLLVVSSVSSIASATDWLTLPSTFSHDATGTRVTQYAPIEPPEAATVQNFRTSGYTQTRSSLSYGQSADHYHRVEKWGDPVRPYGEWRFPYRPFSTPYPNWGPPYAGLNLGFTNPLLGGGFGFGGRPPQHGGDDKDWGDKDYRPRGHDHERGFLGGGRWPLDRDRGGRNRGWQASPLNPYPAGPGSPYPVAPYYDGYYPSYRD